MTGPEGELTHILKEWTEKQESLSAEGLDSKAVANLATDRQRNNDLTFLKRALEDPLQLQLMLTLSWATVVLMRSTTNAFTSRYSFKIKLICVSKYTFAIGEARKEH